MLFIGRDLEKYEGTKYHPNPPFKYSQYSYFQCLYLKGSS